MSHTCVTDEHNPFDHMRNTINGLVQHSHWLLEHMWMMFIRQCMHAHSGTCAGHDTEPDILQGCKPVQQQQAKYTELYLEPTVQPAGTGRKHVQNALSRISSKAVHSKNPSMITTLAC